MNQTNIVLSKYQPWALDFRNWNFYNYPLMRINCRYQATISIKIQPLKGTDILGILQELIDLKYSIL